MNTITIRNSTICEGGPCYLISEIGNNHGGNFDLALRMIEASARSGANAVKFQTFRGRDIVSPRVKSSSYPGWDVSFQYEYWIDFIDSLALDRKYYPPLLQRTHEFGMDFISTALSADAAKFLADQGADALKIASMDVTNLPLLEVVAGLGLPVILSTGMSFESEIEEALQILGSAPLILLHCVSEYPLVLEKANLKNILGLKERFPRLVGFSDHSLGHTLDIAAVALGACAIEKHFTLDRQSPFKAEHHFALEPAEFAGLVVAVRQIEKALGFKFRSENIADRSKAVEYRRSLQLRREMQLGDVIQEKDIIALRPGTGIPPKMLHSIIGRRLARSCSAYVPLQTEDIL